MKCKLEIVEEFNEFCNTCQGCFYYKNCLINSYDNDKNDFLPSGDNFPQTHVFHLAFHKTLRKNRQEMVEKLLSDNLGKITQDDIDDIEIDIGVYNSKCRKQKIKRQYKKRKKKE